MSSILKGGWHPKGKGEGGKESWRGDFKGVNQLAKLAGRGKDDSLSNNGGMKSGLNHSSAPLSTLKDPASFGPPPRHVATGGTPIPVRTSAPSSAGPSARSSPAPQRTTEPQWQAPAPQVEEQQPPANLPYRSNTTGLTTAGIPVPPARRTPTQPSAARPAPPPRPSLPPRQNSRPDLDTPEPPPSYNAAVQQPGERDGYVNQAAVGRLGQAGINMSAFSTGQTSGQTTSDVSSTGSQGHPGQMNELQARFSRMKTPASPSGETAPAAGTSWAQKQQAAQTASKFRNDPSSVSLSDAKDAAATANNFRQRHGEQVNAGWKVASSLNQRYGGTSADSQTAQPPAEPPTSSSSAGPAGKRPPPPPPKKKELQSQQLADPGAPPPIPASSKPRF